MDIRLVPVKEADRPFLFDLRKATMREYIDRTWGWDEQWQKADFDAHFDPGVQRIILVDDVPSGFIHIEQRIGELFIVNFQVAPELQNRGVGTAVLHEVLRDAKAGGLAVGLVVLEVNQRVLQLYERLGFHLVSREPPFLYFRIDRIRIERLWP